jgi:hypothetical protein
MLFSVEFRNGVWAGCPSHHGDMGLGQVCGLSIIFSAIGATAYVVVGEIYTMVVLPRLDSGCCVTAKGAVRMVCLFM